MNPPSSLKKILVVEDDPSTAKALQIRLESSGFTVSVAHDAEHGLSTAMTMRPDLILLDIAMPGGSGLTMARGLQTMPEFRHTPVIFVTGNSDANLRRHAMALNAAGFCEKPYDAAELMSLVQSALSKASSFQHRSESASSTALPDQAPVPRKRILIIEDDQKIAMALSLRMIQANFELSLAYDASTGVSAAVKFQPHLVLLDITMRGGDGFSAAEKIRSLCPPATPIIFLTASKAPSYRKRAAELGAAGFFEKPYDPVALVEAVKSLVA